MLLNLTPHIFAYWTIFAAAAAATTVVVAAAAGGAATIVEDVPIDTIPCEGSSKHTQ